MRVLYAGYCNGLNQWIIIGRGKSYAECNDQLILSIKILAKEKFNGDEEECKKYLNQFRFEWGTYQEEPHGN
mgnify:CR=1 FL=1